jgi:hypothetical protein
VITGTLKRQGAGPYHDRVFRCVLVAIVLAGCTGTVTDDTACQDPAPPAAPAILSLGPLANFVVPDQVVIDVGAMSETGGDLFLALEVGIWRGPERVWRAVTTDPTVHTFRLADGAFEGSALAGNTLPAWEDFVVRARYRVQIADGCISDGDWGARVFKTDDGSAALFDPNLVQEYRVDLSPESVAAMNAEAYPPGCVPYVRNHYAGTLRFGNEVFAGAGAHIKGGCGSVRDLNGKASLKINLSWDDPAVEGCPEKRRLLGLSKLTFNNMVQDPSMTHELLAYAFYRRMGVPVPRAALMKLWVNDQYFGVYLNLETIDRRFLARHFPSNRGMLYEGTYWCDLVQGNALDNDAGCITREFAPDACTMEEPGDDPLDYQRVHELIAALDALPPGGFYPAIESIVEFDTLLSMWAVEAVLSHWDGYVYDIVNNYRVYHDPTTGRWTFIPTGVDQTFQVLDFNPFAVSGRIAAQCLQEAPCAAAFGARAREAMTVFAEMNMTSMRAQLNGQLDGLLIGDPGREFDPGTYANAQAATQSFIDQRPAVMDAYLTSWGF